MRDWRDLNGDGVIDSSEEMFADEMLCTSREEHMSLFGNAGIFDEDEEECEAATDDLITAGIDPYDFELMDEDERREVLEDAGLDSDDYDFD